MRLFGEIREIRFLACSKISMNVISIAVIITHLSHLRLNIGFSN